MADTGKGNPSAARGIVPLLLVLLVILLIYIFEGPKDYADVPIQTASLSEEALAAGNMELRFLDVGGGNCVLVRMPNGLDMYTMLIGAGDIQYSKGLESYLRELGISKIDTVVATHTDVGSIGAMPYIIESFEIGELYMPRLPEGMTEFEGLQAAISSKGITAGELCRGVYIDIPGDAQIEVFSPVQSEFKYDRAEDYSGVLRLNFGQTSFLFTGSAIDLAEDDTAAGDMEISSTVLKLGEGGADRDFLESVEPQIAILDGDSGLAELLEELGCTVYSGQEDSTIIISTDGSQLFINTGDEAIETDDGGDYA